jgi:hypothetical protein
VALRGLKLNHALLAYLRRWQKSVNGGQPLPVPELPDHPEHPAWRIRDKLTPADVQTLVQAFVAGTPQPELAVRYKISHSSVKRLLRKHGVRARPGEKPARGELGPDTRTRNALLRSLCYQGDAALR